MSRASLSVTGTFLFACALLTGGCDDNKNKMALLEETNQQLMDELNGLRDQLAGCQRDGSQCQGELDRARADVSGLNQQLAAARRPQPQPAPVVVQQNPAGWQNVPGGAMIAIDDSVLFDSGKVNLRTQGQSVLQRIVSDLNGRYGDKDILVFGHTDDMPIKKSGWKDNYQLSTERALAVVRTLKDKGVNPNRLVACGCGEYRPRVPNSSAANRNKNRRVEIFALEAETQTARR